MEPIDIRKQRLKIENINALPTVPGTFKKISAVLGKPGVTLDEISRFIAGDPALTTKVLKMVNSAAYGFPGRISSVSHAIMLLGLNVVKGLLLGVSVFEMMEKVMGGLWTHSLAVAAVARAVAERKGVKDPEEISIAGLLHDLGKVILMLEYQPLYEEAMARAAAKQIPIAEAEQALFLENHAAIGLWLAEKWHFPANLVEVIGYHHRPNAARLAPMETAIVHFADILVRARGAGYAGDSLVPVVHPAAFQLLALKEADLREILVKLEGSLDESDGPIFET
ncbi:MAG: HDOD domain-containing protein [Deltaproteobacteria bacterium]|nr:HDOD domain-containing protein [Deltaproteobacteria bacterium]